jgi:hypothetical protein
MCGMKIGFGGYIFLPGLGPDGGGAKLNSPGSAENAIHEINFCNSAK